MKKARWLAGLVGWSLALQMASGQSAPVRLGLPADADTGAAAIVAAPLKAPAPVQPPPAAKAESPATTPPKRFEIVVEQPPRSAPAALVAGEGAKKGDFPKRMPMSDDAAKSPLPRKADTAEAPTPPSAPVEATPLPDTELSSLCAECGLPRMHVWLASEYIYWQTRGMRLPPLVTQAPAGVVGVLGGPTTALLHGDQDVLDEFRSGLLLRGGIWFNNEATVGVDVSGFWLGRQNHEFRAASNGNPGLFRPFLSAGGVQNAVATAFLVPGQPAPVVAGSVHVSATTDMSGADANLRANIVHTPLLRVDGLLGYRYLRLRDTLAIREDLAFTTPASTLIVQDRFETTNEFHGPQIGLAAEVRRGCWTLGASAKLAMGNTRRETFIDGDNVANSGTPAANRFPGGVLAQTSNMGTHINNDFCIVPEAGVTMGIFATERLHLTAGWNFLYWSQVGRAAEQIDFNIGQIPPTPPGPVGPIYQNRNTDFWAHGFRAGVEWKY